MTHVRHSRPIAWLIAWLVLAPVASAVAGGGAAATLRRYDGFDVPGLPKLLPTHPQRGGLGGAPGSGDPTATDIFQRYIIFKNDLPITVYPVISGEQKDNCGTTARTRRIFVNTSKTVRGVPPNGKVKVLIPKARPNNCWHKAARVLIFSVDVLEFEKKLNPAQRTTPDNVTYNPPICDNDACWTGSSGDAYPIDAPAQLIEFTAISMNPATGDEFPDHDENHPGGIPMMDLDLSYVDSVYLPLTMALDDGGATRYMGTAQNYKTFNDRTEAFVKLTQNGLPLWSEFAAFSATNWPNNVFHDLAQMRTNQIGGAYNFVHNVFVDSTTGLYTPTYGGPAQCSQNPACTALAGNCCPANDGTFLDCCPVRTYLIDGTSKVDGKASNPSVDAYVQHWKQWVNGDPCTDLSKIQKWPSESINKAEFCSQFRDTVRYVWAWGSSHPRCANVTGDQKDLCFLDAILGFLSTDSSDGRLNQSVQAVQRGVPWGDPATKQKQWQNDKFVLFWAPYDSIFNLNPYTRLVHNKQEGLDAPGAYSFSIDDRFGNYQNRASGFIVNLGGTSELPNKEPYDFYQQYRVAWQPGWDHVNVCGRRVDNPTKLGSNAPISMWRNGARFPGCRIFIYRTADESKSYLGFRVAEKSKTVTDSYTGLTYTINELTVPDPNFCKNNTTADLQPLCAQAHLSIQQGGDEAYVAVPDAQKPLVNLNFP